MRMKKVSGDCIRRANEKNSEPFLTGTFPKMRTMSGERISGWFWEIRLHKFCPISSESTKASGEAFFFSQKPVFSKKVYRQNQILLLYYKIYSGTAGHFIKEKTRRTSCLKFYLLY
jgi:3-hydroxymyristoyl/3-hydroxydecanoyl-(acyl carrier protein) dehydratase